MLPPIHKYSIHGPEIISYARNKDFKRYREHNSSKCSRSRSNKDIFNSFLISNNPVITSKRTIKKRKHEYILVEALQFLKVSSPSDSSSEEEEEKGKTDDDTDYDF
ncbi:hypothetical protein JTB14_002343 [Gonioctena quinquepunctata]|nr:hypothetical protein JTB14_002343 [Gonioctena quinquepunctata]